MGGRIIGEGDSTAEVRGSNTLVVGRIAGVRGNNTLVVGSIARVRGINTLVVGRIAEVRGTNTLVVGRSAGVRGSNTLVVGSVAAVQGRKTLVGGSTASAFDDTFWSGCALQGEKHTSEEVWRLRNSRPWRTFCLLQSCPISPSARLLHRFKVCVYAMRCISINCIYIF